MDFKDSYPDYVEIEAHIRRARLERNLALAQLIGGAAAAIWRTMTGAWHRFPSSRSSRPASSASSSRRSEPFPTPTR